MTTITGTVSKIESITIVGYAGQRSYLELHSYFIRIAHENHMLIPDNLDVMHQQDFDEATDSFESATIFSDDTKKLVETIREHKDYKRADYISVM